ncbi:hypothetical protein R1flu_025482 [Riccia fluitans]|uniref:Uncharacterized protein n=1 Tax=Riccia fluitans TaxID=41844 RepID=A0ABD1XXV8_9MARC
MVGLVTGHEVVSFPLDRGTHSNDNVCMTSPVGVKILPMGVNALPVEANALPMEANASPVGAMASLLEAIFLLAGASFCPH